MSNKMVELKDYSPENVETKMLLVHIFYTDRFTAAEMAAYHWLV